MTDKYPTVLIDGDIVCYSAAFNANDITDSLQMAKDKVNEKIDTILNAVAGQNTDDWSSQSIDYKIYLTGKGNYRDDIATLKPYKGNRKDVEKPRWLQQVRQHLIDYWGAILSDGEEADDMIAIEATRLGGDCIIASTDKDFKQVPSMNYNFVTNVWTQVDEWEGIRSFYKQMLTGDTVDNIPGIPKVGPVKAEKILKDAHNESDLLYVVLKAYTDSKQFENPVEACREMGRLLWLRRKEGEIWDFPLPQ